MQIKFLLLTILLGSFLLGCARPECKTRAGKQKRKMYNSVQYR